MFNSQPFTKDFQLPSNFIFNKQENCLTSKTVIEGKEVSIAIFHTHRSWYIRVRSGYQLKECETFSVGKDLNHFLDYTGCHMCCSRFSRSRSNLNIPVTGCISNVLFDIDSMYKGMMIKYRKSNGEKEAEYFFSHKYSFPPTDENFKKLTGRHYTHSEEYSASHYGYLTSHGKLYSVL